MLFFRHPNLNGQLHRDIAVMLPDFLNALALAWARHMPAEWDFVACKMPPITSAHVLHECRTRALPFEAPGHLEAVRARFPGLLRKGLSERSAMEIFVLACRRCALEIAIYIRRTFTINERVLLRGGNILEHLASNGDAKFLAWFMKEFSVSLEDFGTPHAMLLRRPMPKNPELLLRKFPDATPYELDISPATLLDPKIFDLKFMMCAVHRFDFGGPEFTPARMLKILHTLCKDGDVDMVRWFVHTFDIRERHMLPIAGGDCPLSAACRGGNLSTAKFLTRTFGRAVFSRRSVKNRLNQVMARGFGDVLGWLMKYFNVKFEDVGIRLFDWYEICDQNKYYECRDLLGTLVGVECMSPLFENIEKWFVCGVNVVGVLLIELRAGYFETLLHVLDEADLKKVPEVLQENSQGTASKLLAEKMQKLLRKHAHS